MSTKIYNGLLIDFPGSIAALRTELIRLAKEELIPAANSEIYKMCARIAYEEVDNERWVNKDRDDYISPTFREVAIEAWESLNDRINKVKQTGMRDPMVDFSASMTLFPLSKQLLAIPFYQHPVISHLITSKPYFKPYPYWNNTDQPDGVSNKEWSTRKDLWNEAIGNGLPSQNGFSIDLISDGYMPYFELDEVEKYAPSGEDRFNTLIERQLNQAISDLYTINHPEFKLHEFIEFSNEWKAGGQYEVNTTKLREEIKKYFEQFSNDEVKELKKPSL